MISWAWYTYDTVSNRAPGEINFFARASQRFTRKDTATNTNALQTHLEYSGITSWWITNSNTGSLWSWIFHSSQSTFPSAMLHNRTWATRTIAEAGANLCKDCSTYDADEKIWRLSWILLGYFCSWHCLGQVLVSCLFITFSWLFTLSILIQHWNNIMWSCFFSPFLKKGAVTLKYMTYSLQVCNDLDVPTLFSLILSPTKISEHQNSSYE